MHCDCEFCKLDLAISLPEHLTESLLKGELVIFAGAGISTESSRVLKFTLYEQVESLLPVSKRSGTFPELMQRFVDLPDGRLNLLNLIKGRFDHIESFPELSQSATRFHKELGTLFLITEIVTTNWDSYFEAHCHATPFVTDPDIALWTAAKRKVLKIHGSIQNLGSVVATTSDYADCANRLSTGLIGSQLKTMLATKTIVFIGYSLRDSDFQQLYGFVKGQMNSLHRQAYVVTPFSEEADRLESDGLIALRTDGTFFVRQLKRHLVNKGIMIDDVVFQWAAELREMLAIEHAKLHEKVKITRLPELIYAASYQDGLAHALERAVNMKGSGEYSHHCRIRNLVHRYLDIQKEHLSRKRYEDVAYIEGYVNGLMFLAVANQEKRRMRPPFYFAFGAKDELQSLTGFQKLFRGARVPHLAARKRAIQQIKKIRNPEGIEFHHPPWL